jgi:2-polyprenyl-3-methyl-5-hydroxy-6-metoxy-1,4-benzoquinol methylase
MPEVGFSIRSLEVLYGLPVRSLRGSSLRPVEPPCPVCGGGLAQPVLAVEGVSAPVMVCAACGLGRFVPMLDPARVASFYPDEYYGEPGFKFEPRIEWLVRLVGSRRIRFISRALRPGARVLDVGCGRGVLLGTLADQGFEAHGVEISAHVTRGVDPRAHIRIAPRLADVGYPAEHFDEVVIWHVLEHLNDPRGTIEEIRRILRPGGRLVVAVPNFASLQAQWAGAAWFHLDLPRHLYHFPLPALRQLLTSAGFTLESEHHFSLRQNPFGWIQSLANCIPGLPRNGLYAMLHRRSASEPPPFGRGTRALFWLWFAASAPFALLASVSAALARRGATVHVVAVRPAGAAGPSSHPA